MSFHNILTTEENSRPPSFFLGCAVFAFAGWKNIVFDPQLPKEKYLHQYAKSFHSVEGNSFFYGIPKIETLKHWRSQVPLYFNFVPKIPREFSHQGKIFSYINQIQGYANLLQEGLQDHLGPVFLQLSPSYSVQYGNDLSKVLNYWIQNISLPICVEFRHRDWFIEPNKHRVNVMLMKMGVSRVILDTRAIYQGSDDPQRNCKNKKPDLPVSSTTTSEICVVRYISHPNIEENKIYLEEWACIVKRWLEEGKQVYFFVHCPKEEYSPEVACMFYSFLKELYPQVRNFLFPKNRPNKQLPLW